MTEALLSAALGVLFDRMASRPVLDFFKSQQLNASLLKKLKNKMITINKVLDDAEDKQHTDPSVKQWHDELKDVVYDAEDLLDEIASEVQRSEIEAESQTILEKVQDFASSHNPFKTAINEKLEEILRTLEDLVDQKDALGLMDGTGGKPSYQRTPTTSIPDESVIYGRDDDKEAIMRWVLSDHPNISNPDVLAIVGIGGMGKTTLAQDVYCRVPDSFDKKAWVCVSEEFNVSKITKDILEGFTKKSSDRNNLNQLQGDLQDDLKEKKFFLVLDDVWSKDYSKWSYLLKPLMSGKEGKVLVTTRDEAVANCIRTSSIHQLQKLGDKDCWSLFEKHAFMGIHMSSAHPNLESIGRQIVKKCDGLPLAAKLLGGALRSNRDPRKWMDILESDMWNLHDEGVLPVLKLSFQFLPSQQKRRFAYCALFPKDFRFKKKDLIRLWMAEGLLTQPRGNEDIEQVAEGCFNDLVSRSFFQYSTESECFVMHDLINDLAKFIFGEFCFRYGVDRKCEIPERIRHLWVGDEEKYEVDKLISKVQHLRTLLCFGYEQEEVMNLLPTFTRLRVLNLCCDKLPDSIGNLMHLRYLNLSESTMERLPDSVASLHNLETLILNDCYMLVELPATIFKLINLSQLDIRGTCLTKMPPHMGKLKKLGELDYYIVGEESHCSIKELGPLKRLGGYLRIEKLRNVSKVQELEQANLKGKGKLKELELIWNDEGSEDSSSHERNVLEQLQPHTNIEKLSISGYAGTRFPDWVGDSSFSKMVELKLKRCKYCFSLPALGQLGSLKRLSIIEFEEITVVGPEFYGRSNKPPFGCLESLTFRRMRQWEEWVPYSSMDEGDGATAFPLLQELVIEECPNLIKTLPTDLPSLKRVTINSCDLRENFTLDLGPALEEINIVKCENLKCLSAAAATELEHLKSLKIEYCPNLKEIQLTHLPSIKRVRINGCDSLESFQLHLGPTLEEINIVKCGNLKCLSAAAELEHLKSLYIDDCDSLESLPLDLDPALEETNTVGCENWKCLFVTELEHLKSLVIEYCPDLKEIQPTHLPSIKRVRIRGCHSLESFPLDLGLALEEIVIEACENLKCLSAAAAAELEHLKSLVIEYCPNLKEIQLTHLPSIKGVRIRGCDSLESFPLDLGPALENIVIKACKNLKCLSAAAAAELEHLKSLVIENCPNLKEIQLTHLSSLADLQIRGCYLLVSLPRAPSLQHLQIGSLYSLEMAEQLMALELKDLRSKNCDSVTNLFFPLDLFPMLELLMISDYPKLESLSITASQPRPLPRFMNLILYKCPTLKRLLSMHNCPESIGVDLMSKIFPNLYHLSLLSCCEEVESFPPENMLLPRTLTSLHIEDFPNLKSFDNTALQSLTCLRQLIIGNCPKLQSLPNEGLPSSLNIDIDRCPLLELRQD